MVRGSWLGTAVGGMEISNWTVAALVHVELVQTVGHPSTRRCRMYVKLERSIYTDLDKPAVCAELVRPS
jgi:hypothetical protein